MDRILRRRPLHQDHFLALGMLSLVEECVELIARRTGTPPDLSRIDFGDPHYDRICAGDTIGLFQIGAAPIRYPRSRPRNSRISGGKSDRPGADCRRA